MEKFSLKSLLTIVVILLIGIVAIWRINQGPKKVEAGWFNEAWSYRKAITLTNSGTGQTNVYVALTIGTSDTSRFQADAGDIRFTKQNGELLPYYIVSGAGTSSTLIHINFDIYPAGASTFYLYYGNSSADNGFSTSNFTTAASNSSTNLLTEELSPAPIAYWSFNEGTGTTVYDSSPSQLDGKFYGNPTWKSDVDCISGNCLYFRGDKDGIEVNNNSKLNNTGATSIGMWIKPTTIDGSISLINRAGFTGPDNGYSFEIYDGKPSVTINNGRVSNSIQRCNQNISINNYYYLYWTRDESNNNKIYINGKECTYSSTIGITQVSTNTSLGIGSKLNKENLAPYSDYSNRNYNQMYDIDGWGGDDAEAYYYSSGGYNNLPYKKIIKTNGGTGGSYINDNAYFAIQDNKTYIISAYMKANRDENLNAHVLNINREADNAYRTSGSYNLSTNWQKYSWVYNSSIGHSGQYHSRHIIYVDNDLPFETYWSGFKVEDVTGTGQTTPSYDFAGNIDEVKIYNYARTATQIKQDYNAGRAGIGSMKGGSVNVGGTQVRNIKDHLVAYYKFDEGYGNTVNNFSSLGTTLNGTLGAGNSAPTWTTGKNNKGLLFDGNDYIDLPNNLNYTNQVSAFAWFKSLGSAPGGYHIIFGGSQLEISIPNSGEIRTGIDTSSRYVSNHGSGITDGNWHYVGFTFDGSTKKSYIDGKYVGQQTGIVGSLANSFSSRRIGRFGSSSTYFANGLIDEVKIYNTALSDAEIKLDYNQGSQFVMGKTNQTIGSTTTSLEYCIPGDTSHCAPPIAEYKFDEGIGTSAFDTSGNNNNCLTSNNPLWTIGKVGKALEFNGTNQRCTKTSGIGTSFITIQAWIYRTSSSQNQGIVRQPSAFAISLYNNTIQVAPGNNWTFYNTGITIPQNSWEHIAWTYDGSIMKVFKNGQIGWTASLAGSFPTNTQDLHVGYDNNNWWWGGKIDQVRIYNYARTPAQIAYDYNKGAPVGWWKFDECEGTMINDWSGIGNTGTLVIGAGGSQVSVGTCSIGNTSAWSNGATGKINSAMSFDGTDDYVNCGDPPNGSLDFGINDFSTSAWFKTSTSTRGVIVGKYNGYPLFYTRINPDGKIASRIGFNVSTNYESGDGTIVNNNVWHNIITVYKRDGNMTRYLDGKIYGSIVDISPSSSISVNTNNELMIGGITGQYFNGLIDDVRIYNYALTAEQVKQIYNGGAVNFR